MSNARFSILQAKAVEDKRISNAQFRTLAALGVYGDKDGWCFPKEMTLAVTLGKSRQAVSRDLIALQELGYIAIKHQYKPDGSMKNSLYRLVFDTINTPPQRDVEAPSTSEVEAPSTSEVAALTPHINDPKEEGEGAEARPARFSDDRTKTPAMKLIKSITGYYPKKANYDDAIAILGETPDESKATECYRIWVFGGRNETGLGWLEWYRDGIPAAAYGPKNGRSSAGSPVGISLPSPTLLCGEGGKWKSRAEALIDTTEYKSALALYRDHLATCRLCGEATNAAQVLEHLDLLAME